LKKDGSLYINALSAFKDNNTLIYSSDKETLYNAINTGDDSKCEQIRFKYCVVATGARPTPLKVISKYAITSDDLFSLENAPGKTLVVGGGYVALECAGFLAGLGYPVTIMTRGLYLRGLNIRVSYS
jgi:thioredoxin reductase (NADPH)